jgi:hypothetical protein
MEFFRIEPGIENVSFCVKREDILAVCDILGFGNFIMGTGFREYSDFVVSVLGALKGYEKEEFNRILQDNPSLRNKLGDEWIEGFGFRTLLVSDTLVFYPKVGCVTSQQFEITLQVLSILLSMLYVFILKKWGLFLRGVVAYGEYVTIQEYPLIWGKGLIEAYRYEKMQNWSGVLLIPSICKVVEKSLLLKYEYVPYKDTPLKDSRDVEKFWSDCKEASMDPYALNWVKYAILEEPKIDEAFWTNILNEIDATLQGNEKDPAKLKVCNTRKFYYYVLGLDK